MTKRLSYIDTIKGVAILLVVMGHVLAWMFSSLAEAQEIGKPMLLWNAIYAFHMPLFIFVSGYLYGQSHFDSIGNYAMKCLLKGRKLVIPYIIAGTIVYLWRGVRPFTYWYLLTLFQLIVIVGGVAFMSDNIKSRRYQVIFELAAIIVEYTMLDFVHTHVASPHLYDFDWFPHLYDMFPYFSIGWFLARHSWLIKLMNNHVYTLAIIAFVVLLFVKLPYTNLFGISFAAIAGIYTTFYLFTTCFTEGRTINYLQRLGRHTLYIYILHFFIDVQIVQLGDYFIWLSQTGKMGFVTCFVLQLFYSVSVSVAIAELSLLVSKYIKTSMILRFAFFGE